MMNILLTINKTLCKSIYKTLTISFIAIFLASCSSVQQNLIITPDPVLLASSQTNLLENKNITLTVNDLRNSQHVVQIIKKDKPAKLINSETSIQALIQSTLTNELNNKSANVTPLSTNQLTVNIVETVINVDQSLVKYKTQLTLVLSVSFSNGEKTLTKNYRRSGTSYGPLTADLAVLSRDFNQQFGKVLNALVNDNELLELIK